MSAYHCYKCTLRDGYQISVMAIDKDEAKTRAEYIATRKKTRVKKVEYIATAPDIPLEVCQPCYALRRVDRDRRIHWVEWLRGLACVHRYLESAEKAYEKYKEDKSIHIFWMPCTPSHFNVF